MLIFVEGANCRCLHFCFLVVNALNLFLVQVPCTWTEFEVVTWQCDEVWSRKVNQDSSDLKWQNHLIASEGIALPFEFLLAEPFFFFSERNGSSSEY